MQMKMMAMKKMNLEKMISDYGTIKKLPPV